MNKIIAMSVESISPRSYYLYSDGSVRMRNITGRQLRENTFQFASPVISMSSGDSHTLFLHADSSVSGIGSNTVYQIGVPLKQIYLEPQTIPDIEDVISISCGGDTSIFLKRDGTVWGCGFNEENHIGPISDENGLVQSPTCFHPLPDREEYIPAVGISLGAASLLLLCDGTMLMYGDIALLYQYPSLESGGYLIPEIRDIINVVTFGENILLLNTQGQVYTNSRDVYIQKYLHKESISAFSLLDLPPVESVYLGSKVYGFIFQDGSSLIIRDKKYPLGMNIISMSLIRVPYLLLDSSGDTSYLE